MVFKKFAWVEKLTVLFVFINIFLVAKPHIEKLFWKAEIVSCEENLANINSALTAYHLQNNTYPQSNEINSLEKLGEFLSFYLKDFEKISFSFISYEGTENSYTLKVKAKDKIFVLTPSGIKEEGSAD